MGLREDAAHVLDILAQPPEPELVKKRAIDGPILQRWTELPPDRLNSAVDLLAERRLVRLERAFHTEPFTFLIVEVTAQGRLQAEERTQAPSNVGREAMNNAAASFISEQRLDQLRSIASPKFDLRRLIRICEELDTCYRKECYLAVAALTRALLDHVPPIFGVTSFPEVANNHRGAKSFRDAVQHLERSARKIGDGYLHIQIRQKETLPTATQVNFANDLDTLLAEIIRVLS